MSNLASVLWPLRKAADAMRALARLSGWHVSSSTSPPPPPHGLTGQSPEGTPGSLSDFMDAVAKHYGLEADPVLLQLAELDAQLRQAPPALLLLRVPKEGILVVLRGRGERLQILSPDGAQTWIQISLIVDALTQPSFAPLLPEIEALLTETGIGEGDRRVHAAREILRRRLGGLAIPGMFLVRLGQGRPLLLLAREQGVTRQILGYSLAHVAQYALGLSLLYLVGRGALDGRIDRGWLWAALLILMAMPPVALIESWLLGRVAISIGILLRRRLLWGAVKLPLDAARQSGYGDFVCQIIESEAVEIGLRAGGIAAGSALLDLLGTLPILLFVSTASALTLLAWVVLVGVVSYCLYRTRQHWTESRFHLVGDLLEKMLGHRTRLVQEPRAQRHRGEDEALVEYHRLGRTLDGWSAALFGLLPYGWLSAGLISLIPRWLDGGTDTAQLGLGLGGVMLAFRALSKLGSGLSQLGGVAIALRRCRHLLHSAAAPEPLPLTAALPSFARDSVVLEARRVTVRYSQGGATPALRDLTLRIRAGQRLLVQGPSGSGKSTLASCLTGLLPLENGQILLGGLDMSALGGRAWRRLVSTAPQFHENHLFSQSLAFNLLLGRAWPPSAADLADAQKVCEDLGLGPLLQRMPSGLHTHVGETGWQLSHGERSRVYIARTLLQRAQVILLDESFAALDPETLSQTLRCVFERAPTLLVIAHP